MGQMQNWFQLLIVLLVIIGPALSWVWKKIQEQHQLKQLEAERERRRLEMLRTGRVSTPPQTGQASPAGQVQTPPAAAGLPDDPKRRLMELAERRRKQLEDLRRRQAGMGGSGGGAGGAGRAATATPPVARPPQPVSRPTAAPPRQPQPARPPLRPQPQRPVRPTRTGRPATPSRPVTPAPVPQGSRPLTPTRPAVAPIPLASGPETARSVQTKEEVSKTEIGTGRSIPDVAGGAGASVGRLQRDEVRRGIIMAEVLGPPMAMRKSERLF